MSNSLKGSREKHKEPKKAWPGLFATWHESLRFRKEAYLGLWRSDNEFVVMTAKSRRRSLFVPFRAEREI